MNNVELLKMAFVNLFRRKARSILAILGVIIGTASIVTMVSIGLGISKNFSDSMEGNFELHMIRIYGITPRPDAQGKTPKLDDNAIKSLKQIKGVTAVTPMKYLYTRMIIGNYVGDINVTGIDPEFFQKMKLTYKKGRGFTSSDKNTIVVGSQLPTQMTNYITGEWLDYSPTGDYPGLPLISSKVELTKDEEYKKQKKGGRVYFGTMEENEGEKPKYDIFKVQSVGILEKESFSYDVFTSLETIDKITKSNDKAESQAGRGRRGIADNDKTYDQVSIYVDDVEKVEEISETLKKSGYQFYSIMDEIKQAQNTFAMIQGALGAIGAISLIVAAIGITNTMIMSIYERTREIGVMKVIGASLKDIQKLFLSEAAAIGLIGGIVGSVLSLGLSFALNFFFKNSDLANGFINNMSYMGGMGAEPTEPYISYMPIWLILFGILFSTIIGVLAGYFPSRKAMSLSALESLRNE